jgi:hypothetical protein
MGATVVCRNTVLSQFKEVVLNKLFSVLLASMSIVVSPFAFAADFSSSIGDIVSAESQNVSTLQGTVSTVENRSAFAVVNRSLEGSVSKKAKHGSAKSLIAGTKSLGNFVLDLRGFDWSIQGADAILDQAKHEKSAFAKEYLLRREHDARELAATRAVLQLAAVLDRDSVKADRALGSLQTIVGKENAQLVQNRLRASYTDDELLTEREHLIFDIEQKNEKLKNILSAAASQDEVLKGATKRLEKFNHRSKFMQYSAKVVYTTLGIASFSPTLVAPIAGASLLAFMMATGGPEQDKLLKEIYLGKIMQSRCDVLNEKAHLVTEGLDLALLTNNKRLYACTKELLGTMSNADQTTAFLGLPEGNVSTAQVEDMRTENKRAITDVQLADPTVSATSSSETKTQSASVEQEPPTL